MGMLRRILLVTLACAATAAAEQGPTTIESEGQASVAISPDEVRFDFTRMFEGPTLIEVAAQAQAFEKALAQALDDLDVKPLRQEPVRLSIAKLSEPDATGTVSAWFAMPVPNTPGDGGGPPPLAELAEKIRKACVSLTAEVAFGGFTVLDKAPVEQDAVSRAAENALYQAEAIGELVEGSVTGVERVTIVETRWEGLAPGDGTLTIPAAVSCHARVRIAYQYSRTP